MDNHYYINFGAGEGGGRGGRGGRGGNRGGNHHGSRRSQKDNRYFAQEMTNLRNEVERLQNEVERLRSLVRDMDHELEYMYQVCPGVRRDNERDNAE